jgi:hypothetical protein
MEIYKQLVYEVCLDMDSIERLDRFLAEANSGGGQ